MTEEKEAEERKRVFELLTRERQLHDKGILLVGGVDEAGRGPLAGPVVASCVILPDDFFVPYLNDSKKVTARRREEIFPLIISGDISAGVGLATPEEIDSINILNATYLAMKRSISSMSRKPDYLINDAVHIPGLDIEQESIVKGDAKVACIAAASILAKVTRDHIMEHYDRLIPEYRFIKHKGYPTREHYELVEKYGILPIYRRSFLSKRIEEGRLMAEERRMDLPDPFDLADDFLGKYGITVVR